MSAGNSGATNGTFRREKQAFTYWQCLKQSAMSWGFSKFNVQAPIWLVVVFFDTPHERRGLVADFMKGLDLGERERSVVTSYNKPQPLQ
jgi:hypothetical protein